jgi:hypothetical protein
LKASLAASSCKPSMMACFFESSGNLTLGGRERVSE